MTLIQRRHYEEKHTCFEMANLRKQESGLPYDIWLDSAGCTRNTQHNVMRIKVGVGDELIPVIITSQRDIRPLRPFRMEMRLFHGLLIITIRCLSIGTVNYQTGKL